MHTSYISLPWGSSFLHIGVNHTRYPCAKRPSSRKRYNYYLLVYHQPSLSIASYYLWLLIIDVKWQNRYNRPVTLHSLGQAGFHCHDRGWEGVVLFHVLCGGPIETNTLHHILPHPSNSLVEGDPHGGVNYTILCIPWLEGWGHETPTVLNRSKVYNPCLCRQL